MKKNISLILICIFILSLCACGKKEVSNDSKGQTQGEKTVWYLGGNNIMAGDVDVEELFKNVEDTVQPDQVYNSLKYSEVMLHGAYTLNNLEKDVKKVRDEIPFEEVNFKTGSQKVASLPIAVYFGAQNICCSETGYKYGEFQTISDCEVAVLQLATEEKVGQLVCTYEVNGNSVIFKQIEQTSGENEPFAYEYTGIEFEYDFKISGPYFTISKDGNSLKLKAFCFTENVDSELSLTGYSLPDSPLVGELDYFASAGAWNYAVRRDGSYYDLSAYKMTDDGRFTIYLADNAISGEKEEFVGQYAYIVQSSSSNIFTDFSILLLDGTKEYYYTDDITQREARVLKEQGTDVATLTEDEIKEIAEKKSDLFDDLQREFETQGLNVTINRSSGEIAMDASVLFGGDSADVTADGKDLLNKFLKVYISIVYNEKYDGFISKTMVEGHAAPLAGSTYESGLQLSEQRANNVKDYCLSSDTGIDTSKLASTLEAVGLSNSKPVYDSNGEVDVAACRRVSFRFIVSVE